MTMINIRNKPVYKQYNTVQKKHKYLLAETASPVTSFN